MGLSLGMKIDEHGNPIPGSGQTSSYGSSSLPAYDGDEVENEEEE